MISLNYGNFQENKTYQAYNPNNVFKCTFENLQQTLDLIKQGDLSEKFLIELPNTIGISNEIIDILPDNLDVRIIGGLTEEYAKSHKGPNLDYLREKATYSKEELKEIISKIHTIESKIDSNWNEYEKALYLYEYLKSDIVYRTTEYEDLNGKKLDDRGNTRRTRTWDTLTGLINQLSTCSGFAHIYQELCTRNGIDCVKVGGKYLAGREGDHAWNVITIDDKNFLVDIIWDAQDYEKGIDHTTGFGTLDSKVYDFRCYRELKTNLSTIDPDWIKTAVNKVSKDIPKQQLAQEKIENFLKIRELDRQRMMQLRQKQLLNVELMNQPQLSTTETPKR